MRIVTVLTSLGMGGAEKQALAVTELMARRGHAVTVLVLRPQVEEEWPTTAKIVHLDVSKSPVSFLAGVARARRLLRDIRPDVVHSHSFHANIFARLVKIAVPSLKVLSTVHNIYEGGRLRMLSYRMTSPLAVRTVAVSQAVADRFIGLGAIEKRKRLVITNGIDTVEFAPDGERRERTRAEMGAGSKFIWLAAGRLVAAKDFPNLLRAFRLARLEVPGAELWIAGVPPDTKVRPGADGNAQFVRLMAVERDCLEQVRWLGLRRDMHALLDAADGFVLGSAWEGMPLAVGEAMAMEKPVVVTDSGGMRELVGDAGVVVPVRDQMALAEAMMGMMRETGDRRAELGRAARKRVGERFAMDAATDAWEALYRQVISGQ